MGHRFIIDLEPSDLFDKLAGNRDLQEALGQRMVELLLAPPGFISALGLAFYGITVTEADPITKDT